MATESLRFVRDHLSEVVDRVERHHERVVVTRNGKEAAVIESVMAPNAGVFNQQP